MPVSEIQRLLDTGIGSKEMKRIRHHYFRDDLKILWGLLNSFFTYNTTDSEIKKEYLLVRNFQAVFERMIDSLISDDRGVTELKKQKDGKLVDHIFPYKSLIGSHTEIYYIGDSKYYSDANRPEGVALYKQFTYAKNAIQYHIDKIYLPGKSEGTLHYRDKYTEGYNITPNFFIRSLVTKDDISFDMPSIAMTYWDETKHLEYPRTNKHFEDRIFDRDTLILREFSVNLLFVIAAYAGYEEEYWKSDFHRTIRELFIKSIDKEYEFFILTPKDEDINKFHYLYFEWINGKAYTLESDSKTIPNIFSWLSKEPISERKTKKPFSPRNFANIPPAKNSFTTSGLSPSPNSTKYKHSKCTKSPDIGLSLRQSSSHRPIGDRPSNTGCQIGRRLPSSLSVCPPPFPAVSAVRPSSLRRLRCGSPTADPSTSPLKTQD